VRFNVDSYILFQLGERLFTRKALALAELVKNGYDADATTVTIGFQNVSNPHGTITVEDNGEGMSYDLLQDGWMRIATYEKQRNPFSRRFRRPRAGAKGVGRFASRVLSTQLILESVATVSSGRKEKVRALIDWEKFKAGSKVDAVAIPVTTEAVPFATPTGTKLTLKDVPEAWTQEDVHLLRKELFSLISSFTPETGTSIRQAKGDPGFQIVIRSPEFKEEEGPLSETFLQTYAWGRLVGTLDSSGVVQYTLVRRKEKQRNTFKPDRKFPNVGKFSFRVDLVRYAKDQFPGGEISLREAQSIGREQGGVRIYFDGFRVSPYGEPNDDWLGIDSDRARRVVGFRELEGDFSDVERPMLSIPGNNQLFGGAFLSRVTNPGIEITMTRERLLENAAFDELRGCIRLGIEWMTVQYARWIAKNKPTPSKRSPLEELRKTREAIFQKKEQIGPEATAEILQSIQMAEHAFQQREDDRISEVSMLRVLATSGTLISIFQHELAVMVDEIQEVGENLDKLHKKLSGPVADDIKGISSQITSWVESVREYGKQLGLLLGLESRTNRRSYLLRPLLDDIVRPFSRHFSEYGIVFINHVNADLKLPPMYKSEIASVFLNLMTNSAKAVKESDSRKILVESSETSNDLVIRFLDSGPGVPQERRKEIFEPFVSDSAPDPFFGQGTGLGLTIVRNLVDTYGGEVKFIDPPQGWGACLEIRFQKGALN